VSQTDALTVGRLDERTSELDAASGEAVWNAVRQKLALGAVVVIATSDPVLIEHCDQAIRLRDL
jgi:ABC-type lipoprotein export system ATPase subunit